MAKQRFLGKPGLSGDVYGTFSGTHPLFWGKKHSTYWKCRLNAKRRITENYLTKKVAVNSNKQLFSAFCLRLLKKLMPRAIMHSIMQGTVCFLKISKRGVFCYKDERYSLQETASDDNGLPQDMSGESFVMELYGRQ